MNDRLTPEREAEIRERTPKRAAALTSWIDKFSPFPEGQREVENAETVLEEDVPALLAELAAVRAELDAEKAAHRFTLRQRNNRSNRILHLRGLANAAATGGRIEMDALITAARDTLAASVDDHKACGGEGR